jgi:4-amino-4-deoxy-L-arabinose transferase-like glycosyltransferase
MKIEFSENRLNDWLIVSFLVAFTLLFRLLTLQMINVGPDEIDYWYSAKILFSKVPYGELTHRTVRWGIILPTFLIQRIFGTHPIVYILGPILLSCLQSYFAYDVGRRLFNRGTGILAVLMLTVFPYMIRSGSQIRPEIFTLTYLLAGFWAIVRKLPAFRTEKDWWGAVITAALLVFCAYETKITNVYFVPFFAVMIYSIGGKRPRPLLAFLGLLAAAYLVEHLAYLLGAGARLGRLSIIARTHLESSYTGKFVRYTFLGLFDRFNGTNFPMLWKLAFLFYVLAAASLAFRWKGNDKGLWNRLVFLLVLSFTLFLTFAVKSIRPTIPMESYQNRYFTALLPWMFLLIGAAIMELPGLLGTTLLALSERWTRVGLVLCGIMLAFLGIFYFRLYPGSFAEYAPALSEPREHTISLYLRYTRLVNRAWDGGLPVVSVYPGEEDSGKAIDTVNRVFLRWRAREAARPTAKVVADGFSYQFIAREGIQYGEDYLAVIDGAQILAVDRFPFRVWISTLAAQRSRYR